MKIGFYLSIGENCNSKPLKLSIDNYWPRSIEPIKLSAYLDEIKSSYLYDRKQLME